MGPRPATADREFTIMAYGKAQVSGDFPFSVSEVKPRGVTGRLGFTLVEMVAVVLIISIMLGISSAAITGARRTAMRTHSMNTVKQLTGAWSAYLTDQGSFPQASKFEGRSGDSIPATAENIGGLLNTQYHHNGKPITSSVVYYETTEEEVERTGTYPKFSYKGHGIIDRWGDAAKTDREKAAHIIYFNLDFDLVGRVTNPINGNEVTAPALAYSTAGFAASDMGKYGSKFLVAW